jgi:hypothetical protein
MLTGVLCIYIVLVLLLKDFVQPVTILAALVLSVPGAFLALFVTGTALSMPSMIGLIMLMGIATKNSILLIDYVILARREHGLDRWHALLDACRKRARPIVMTTVAMGAGMLPIAIGLGTDPSFRAPMAIVVIGGLITSTFLSLLVIPVVFTYVHRMTRQPFFPAVLARSRQARQFGGQRAVRVGGKFLEECLDRGDIGKPVQAFAIQPQLARRLRAAQHQHREQRRGLRRHAQRLLETVREAGHPTAADFRHQAQRGQGFDGLEQFAVARLHQRMAAGLLIASRRQRVQRQGVAVGHRALLFDEGADDAGFQQGERRTGSGHRRSFVNRALR